MNHFASTTRDVSPIGERVRLFVYWLVVGIPLGWGVWQVVAKSLVLCGIGH